MQYCWISLAIREGELRPLVINWAWICLSWDLDVSFWGKRASALSLGSVCMWLTGSGMELEKNSP